MKIRYISSQNIFLYKASDICSCAFPYTGCNLLCFLFNKKREIAAEIFWRGLSTALEVSFIEYLHSLLSRRIIYRI
jgi:hypothetical protein